MPTTPTQGASATDDMHSQVVEFPDNFLLIDLCGAHDRNLAEIERTLEVQILRRGNQLAVHGETPQVADAVEVLQSLYQRLETGKEIVVGDIDRELRMGGSASAPGPNGGHQLEMFKGGRIEIKTRKKLVEPRTEAQRAYMR